ncbi:hypothetical protein Tcan_11132 [Toxocara canis]|uniref:Secreted protein n=1 Tax=Toxocara canis TaxID=6265 RepID=A0A0B2VC89_TOXCA|nr:hypothetical protein Tcan_11132 [Toxocara canis]
MYWLLIFLLHCSVSFISLLANDNLNLRPRQIINADNPHIIAYRMRRSAYDYRECAWRRISDGRAHNTPKYQLV